MRFVVHLLMILALASAGASPACAFVSGQAGAKTEDGLTYYEICRGLDMVTVAVDENGNEVEVDGKGDSPAPQVQSDPCSFCFAASHLKPVMAGSVSFTSAIARIERGVVFSPDGRAYRYDFAVGHGVRAPPFTS